MRSRTSRGMSTYVSVVISPATTTRPVVISVSHATRLIGSSRRTASRTESEIWSAILSGWPSVTDSAVKVKERLDMGRRLADTEKRRQLQLVGGLRAVREEGAQGRQPLRHLHADEAQERQRLLDPGVGEAGRLARHADLLLRGEERGVARELRAAAAKRVDPRLGRRDDELAADRGAYERCLLQRARRRQGGKELVERVRGGGGVGGLGHERHLRDEPSAARVDRGLAAEERVELGLDDLRLRGAEELLQRLRQ